MSLDTTKSSAQLCLAGFKRTGLLAALAVSVALAPTLRATLLWEADTTRGTSVFQNLDIGEPGGSITVAADPLGQFGNVYKYYMPDEPAGYGKERTESKGTVTPSGTYTLANNTDYYIGWRSMWNPMPSVPGWVALFQIHGYGPSGQPAPLVLRCLGDGNISLQNGVSGGSDDFWHVPLRLNVWQSFVVHINISADPTIGYVEVWYNGVPQTLQGGVTRMYCQTVDAQAGSYDAIKWGVYRSGAMDGTGPATAYMSGGKLGTTYADVDPMPASATPTFMPAGGTYTSAQSVSIATSTPGASIRYTTDGSTPSSTTGTLYSGPVSIGTTTTLKAVAYGSGYRTSSVATATYTINVSSGTSWEAENLSRTVSGATATNDTDASASGGVRVTLNSTGTGQWMEFTLPNVPAGTYSLQLAYKSNNNRGTCSFLVDGASLGGTLDQYASTATYPTATVGTVTFGSTASHTFRMTVNGKNASSSGYTLSADKLTLVAAAPTLAFEAESLTVTNSGVGTSLQTDANTSGGQWISLNATGTGSWMEFTLPNIPAGTYSVRLAYKSNNNRGQCTFRMDGTTIGGTLDQYASTATYPTYTVGTVTFGTSGNHAFRMVVSGKNASSSSYTLSADKITLVGQ